jgi:hypothetical protein
MTKKRAHYPLTLMDSLAALFSWVVSILKRITIATRRSK